MVEYTAHNGLVAGSSPAKPSIKLFLDGREGLHFRFVLFSYVKNNISGRENTK